MDGSFKKAGELFASLLGRGSDAESAGPSAHREPEVPENWPDKLPFRKRPKPYSRAISWSPTSEHPLIPSLGPPEPDKSRPYELFVAQSALREVRRHLITASTREPFGFLLGQVIFCPWSEAPYVVVDAVRRETQNLPSSSEADRFRHAWIAATRDARHRRAQLIGWYHQHGVLGLRMSEWDLKLQDEFFPEPWQCALIIAYANGPTGGFIQRSHRARLFRKGLAPFYELTELDAKLVDGLRPSVVDWRNYVASQDVHILEAKWPDADAQQRRWSPEHAAAAVDVLEFPAPEDVPEPSEVAARTEAPAEPAPSEPEPEPEPEPAPPEPLDLGDDLVIDVPEEGIAAEEAPADDVIEDVPADDEEPLPEPAGPAKPRVLETPMFPLEAAEPIVRPPVAATLGEVPEPEAAEVDRTRSSEWLVELMGEVLAHRRTAAEPAPEVEAAEELEAEPAAEVDAADTRDEEADEVVPTTEPPVHDEVAAGEAEAATEPADEPTEAISADEAEAPADDTEPEPTEAPAAAGVASAPPRETMGTRYRQIPVVLIEDEPWRPSKKLIRAAAGIVILLGVGLSARALIGGSEEELPVRPTEPRPTVFQQPPEFTRLSTQFRTRLQDFRTDFVDFQRGSASCDTLGSDFLAVRAAHAALSEYVAVDSRTAPAFSSLDADYEAAADRFAATGCALPAAPPEPEAGSPPGSVSPSEAVTTPPSSA